MDTDHQHNRARCRPLNVVAFATLPAQFRYEGTALISLLRNIGSAIGISVFEALVTNNTQVEHSVLAPFASPLNRALQAAPWPAPATAHGAALLDQTINYQAQVIAYNNDYWLMGLLALPLLALLPFMTRHRAKLGVVTVWRWTDRPRRPVGPALSVF